MDVINASEFRKQCLALLDHLPEEGVVITKHGHPVAKLVPLGPAGQMIADQSTSQKTPGTYITAPLIRGRAEPGPLCPVDENPYDLLFT